MRAPRQLFPFLFRRSEAESELSDELRFHIENRIADLVRAGLPPEEAGRQARIEFGGMEAYKERCREAGGMAWFDELRGNLRYTLRTLRMNPGFALATVLSLAVGIGVNTSAVASVNSMVLHPFPFPQLERVMVVWGWNTKLGVQQRRISPPDFLDWRENARAFEHLAAFRGWNVTLTGVDNPESVSAFQASKEYFDVFQMPPRLGRNFTNADCEPGHDGVVIVSDGFWKSHLASAPEPIGKTISLDRRTFTVIGVMPEAFDYPLGTDLWAPLALTPQEKGGRDRTDLYVVARLKKDTPVVAAQAEMTSISAELERRYPATNEGHGVLVRPIREDTNNVTGRFVFVLLGAATFVLLLACANAANLQLTRSTSRQREIGLRAALGASRARVARELMTETIVLGALAGIVGLILAYWDLRLIVDTVPIKVFRWVAGMRNLRLDGGAAALGLGLSVAAALACSIPATYHLLREQGRASLSDLLKEGGRGSSAGSARNRLRSALVVIEVALALVLLIGAGLMVRTFQRILAQDRGYDPKNVLILNVWRPAAESRDSTALAAFYNQVLERAAQLPGVDAAAVDGDVGAGMSFSIQGRSAPRPGEPRPILTAVSPGYFRTLRIPLLKGRPIEERDGSTAPRVAVLSQSMVRHYWPDSDPIGQQIRLWGPQSDWATVIGVSGDVKDWFSGGAQYYVYVSQEQTPSPFMTLSVRTTGDPIPSARGVRAAIRLVDRNQPVGGVETMEQSLAEETSGVRAAATRMSVFAGISLFLSLVGCYAVGSFSVARRTQEIGIRMTLGATRQDVLRMILGQTARMALIGLAGGLTLTLALTRLMSHALFNIVALEPVTFIGLTALLAGAALLAGYIPAYRASRIDPAVALRDE